MKFKFLSRHLSSQSQSIFNKNERLATNVVENIPTSKFDQSFRHLTTFDSCKLVPIFVKEALPGDIFELNQTHILRMSSPTAATMESPIYDVAYFFVPNRIIWKGWKYFMGENAQEGYQRKYENNLVYSNPEHQTWYLPYVYTESDLMTYLGYPVGSKLVTDICALPIFAYIKIWNDYYRDQNLQSEIPMLTDEAEKGGVIFTRELIGDADYLPSKYHWFEWIRFGKGLAPVGRLVDYFSTCLPWPQKGDAVSLAAISLANLSVVGNVVNAHDADHPGDASIPSRPFSPIWYDEKGNINPEIASKYVVSQPTGGPHIATSVLNASGYDQEALKTATLQLGIKDGKLKSTTGPMLGMNVNDLRMAVSLQHMLELDARSGSRYVEMLLSHFGIYASDVRMDRAEYIGGMRGSVQIDNVVQSSASVQNSPLGNIGGVSVTGAQVPYIQYACEEHGFVLGLLTVRPQVNYSQGLSRFWTRKERFDYYDPVFANIGEQPVFKREIFFSDTEKKKEIFGYNEAWADYRYEINRLSGYMSVNSSLTLASLYAYTEKYTIAPTLTAKWFVSSSEVIGSTLLLQADKHEFIHQFLGDFYFNLKISRRMPVFSIPGLKRI